ncbi:MAG: LptF/LptG family permease [Nitrospiraceae bacterium]|nr:MAG: LptF/LptG family permease [Nitrospiraceae bacterium]
MTTFRRYFITEFFKYFAVILICFTSISNVAEFLRLAGDFYDEKAPIHLIIQYLALQSPRVILYALPFASLFSILITLGIASKWRETTVIKASGGSIKRLFSCFLLIGILMMLSALILGETVVPEATRASAYIRKVKIMGQSPKIVYGKKHLWMRGLDGSLVRIEGFVEDENKVLKTSVFSFNDDFVFEKRIEANEAEWINDEWNLKDVKVYDFRNNSTKKYSSLKTESLEEPDIFREEIKKPNEMNFMELYSYYSRLEKAGFKNLKYIVRLYDKLAYPSINFVMILFGVALALHSKWGGGIRAAGLGVLVSVLYWMLYSFSLSLVNTGYLKPWLAPWVSPAVFCLAGSIMYMRIRE